MLAVLAIVAALVLLVGFAAFAIHRMKPDWLKIKAESRLAKFSMEIGRSERPPDDRSELEAGRDGLRSCWPSSPRAYADYRASAAQCG